MARNGSGTYGLPAGNPVVTGTVISSTWANTTLADIGTALTNSLAKDGQTTPTANLPMGGFKLTGLAAGTASGDSVRFNEFSALISQNSGATEPIATYAYMFWADTTTGFLKQRNAANTDWIIVSKLSTWAVASVLSQAGKSFTTGGTSTAFTITTDVLLPALVTGEEWDVTFNAAAGATPTLARDGLTAKNLKYRDSTGAKTAITSSQVPSGWRSKVVYDGTDYVVREVVPASSVIAFNAFRTTSSQSVSSGTFTKVQLNAKGFDTNSNFDSTTNYRFTPTVAGYYQVNGCMSNSGSAGYSSSGIGIFKNGALAKRGTASNVGITQTVSTIIYMNGSTDYLELYAYVTASGSASFDFGSDNTYFEGFLVARA